MFYAKPAYLDQEPISGAPDPEIPGQYSAGFSDVYGAGVTAGVRTDQTFSRTINESSIFDDHNKMVKELTGKDLPNPAYNYYSTKDSPRFYKDYDDARRQGVTMGFKDFERHWNEQEYRKELGLIGAENPAHLSTILPEKSFASLAYERARQAEASLANAEERMRPGFGRSMASILGRMTGAMADPVNIATLPLGIAGAGQGWRAMGLAAVKSGGINAGTEALVAPFVQQYRAEAGLDYGAADAAFGIASAFVLGAGLDLGIRGVARGMRAWGDFAPVVENGIVVGYRKRDRAPQIPDDLAERAKAGDVEARAEVDRLMRNDIIPPDVVQRADALDPQAIREVAEKSGSIDDPMVRQTLDAMDADERLATKPSEMVSDFDHAANLTQALRHAATPDLEPAPVRVDETPPVPQATAEQLDALTRQVAELKGDVVGLAKLIKQQPETVSEALPVADGDLRLARNLAALDDAAFARVAQGEVNPELAGMVGEFVADPAQHSRMLDDLIRAKPSTPTEARQRVAEFLRSPDYAPQVPDVGSAPGLKSKALDDPFGPDAKQQVAALEQQMAEELGRKADAEVRASQPPDPVQVRAAQVEAISFADRIAGLVREVVGAGADEIGLKVRTYSSAADLPGDLRVQMEQAQAAVMGLAMERWNAATTPLERAAAREMLDAAKRGEGTPAFYNDATVWIATYAANPRMYVAHELIHALKALRKLTQDEIASLAMRARRLKLFDEASEAAYRNQMGDRATDALIAEEAAARLMEAYFNGRAIDLPKTQAGILDRLAELFATLRARLQSALGMREAEVPPRDMADQIVKAFTSGEIARRQVDAEQAAQVRQAMAAEDITALAVKPEGVRAVELSQTAETLRAEVAALDAETGRFTDPESGEVYSAGEVNALVDMWRYVQEMKRAPKPETLTQWIMRTGRLQDQNGELTNILGGKNRQLISGKGRNLDDAALAAWEQGFLATADRPTVRDLLDAIDNDVRGDRVVRSTDYDAEENVRVAREMETELDRLGLINAKSEDDIRARFARASNEGLGGGEADAGRAASEKRLASARAELASTNLEIQSLNDSFMAAMSDLDMSPEARKARAEAMGFDTRRVWYHGTKADFDAFDPGKVLDQRAKTQGRFYRDRPRMVFLSGDSILPQLFGGGPNGRLLEIYAKRDLNLFDGLKDAGKLAQFIAENEAAIRDGLTMQPEVPLLDDVRNGGWQVIESKPVQDWLRTNGYDGFVANESRMGPDGKPNEILAVFDTANKNGALRSTNAAFDPALSDSPNLMFAMADASNIQDKIENIEAIQEKMRLLPEQSRRALMDGYDVVVMPSIGNATYYVVPSGRKLNDRIGTFIVKPSQRMDATGVEVTNAQMAPKSRRQGIGTALYNIVDQDWKDLGGLSPSPRGQLSPLAQEFWGKRLGHTMFAFAGERAKTADLDALTKAKQMAADGIERTKIWTDTGWFKGVDGKWRFEIDDSQARMANFYRDDTYPNIVRAHVPKNKADYIPQALPLEDYISHAGLERAYWPTREQAPSVIFDDLGDRVRGRYSRGSDLITMDSGSFLAKDEGKSTALHELQHRIQYDDGFALGYNPIEAGHDVARARFVENELRQTLERMQNAHHDEADSWLARSSQGDEVASKFVNGAKEKWYKKLGAQSDENPFGITDREAVAYELTETDPVFRSLQSKYGANFLLSKQDPYEVYKRHAGEVEARTVQKRMDLSPDERRARPPWEDYDVPESEQIVRFANGESLSMFAFSEPPPVEGPAMRGMTMFAIRAYHGSPHDFERFDMSRIGTGEGAQAYGFGLYFAEAEAVAKQYRDNLSGQRTWNVPPEKISPQLADLGFDPKALDFARNILTELKGDGAQAVGVLDKLGQNGNAVAKEAASAIRSFHRLSKTNEGRLYEVSIKADPEDFLDWDLPLSQQSEKVRAALSKVSNTGQQPVHYSKSGRWHVLRSGEAEWSLDEVKGGFQSTTNAGPIGPVYRSLDEAKSAIQKDGARSMESALPSTLMSRLGGHSASPEATQALRDAGIVGIRYLDQGSRTAGGASRNYVVFDDSLIEITAKDGQPVTSQDRADVVSGMTGQTDPNPMFAMGDERPVTPGLDMSPEARKARAEAMGFDTSRMYYHGTDKTFSAFDTTSEPSTYAADQGLVFLTSDPKEASGFALYGPFGETKRDSPQVLPLLIKRDKFFVYGIDGKVDPTEFFDQNSYVLDDAIRQGFSGVIVHNYSTKNETVVTTDPTNIRSVNAAFDPANAGSANLMFAMRDEGSPSPDLPSIAARMMEMITPYLEQVRGMDAARLTNMVERDGDGNVSAVVNDGTRYSVTRDDEGNITGITEMGSVADQAMDGMAAQEATVRQGLAGIIAQTADSYGGKLAPERAEQIAGEALDIARAAPADPIAALNAVTELVNRTAAEMANPVMFALRDEQGRPKAGAAARMAQLQEDLANIEAAFQASGGDDRLKLQVKRAALLQAVADEKVLDDLAAYRTSAGQSDKAEGLMRLMEADAVTGGASDVKTLREVIRNDFLSDMDKMIWHFRKGAITGDKRRLSKGLREDMAEVIRAAAGEKVDTPLAQEFAKSWLAVAEKARQRFNAAGGDIGKLPGWYAPQYHDAEAWLKAGQQTVVDYFVPAQGKPQVLDRARMLNRDGSQMTDAELRKMMGEIWYTVTTGGANKIEPGQTSMGKGALYKQRAEHRVLHYASPDAWLAYNREFGGGDVFAAMLGHLDMMARDIAAMERFGPNPTLGIQRAVTQIKAEAGMTRSAKSVYDDLAEKVSALQKQLRTVPAEATPIMTEIGRIHSELDKLRAEDKNRLVKRNVAAIEKLDDELFAQHQKFREAFGSIELPDQQGILFKQISDMMDEMAALEAYPVMSRNPVERADRLLSRAEEIWKLYAGHTNTPTSSAIAGTMVSLRNWVGASALTFASFSSVLSDPVMQMAARAFIGMPVTKQLGSYISAFSKADRKLALEVAAGLDQVQAAFAEQARYVGWLNTRHVTGYLADRTHALSFLSPMTQAQKTAFSLDFLSWMAGMQSSKFSDLPDDARRMLARHDVSPVDWEAIRTATPETKGGRTMLTRDAIEAAAGTDMADKYMVMLTRERGRAVIEATLRGRSMFISETKPGTIAGEAARSMAMLKSFPTSYMTTVLGTLYGEILAGRGRANSTMAYGAAIFAVGTIAGAMAMQMKNIGHGRDPQDMTKAKFWFEAFMQSGGLGIFGDFIGSSVNRFGGGLAQTLAGPLAGRASTILDLTAGNIAQYANDEKTNIGREVVKALRQNTPGALVPFYLRQAYERLILDELQRAVDPDVYRSFQQQKSMLKKRTNQEFYNPPGGPMRAPNFGAAFGQ